MKRFLCLALSLFVAVEAKASGGGFQQPYVAAPTQFGRLAFWYDASDPSTITIATGVSQWADKSGNGVHATQGTAANQPTSGANTINGRNVITFGNNVAQKYLVNSGTNSPNTVSAVFKSIPNAYVDWEGVITARAAPNSNKVAASTESAGWTGDLTVTTNVCNVGQTSVAAYRDGVITSAANFDNFLVGASNSPIDSQHLFTYTDDIGSAGTQNFAIGADVFDIVGARHFNGYIGEIYVYNDAKSLSVIMALSWYAKRKWAIQ